MVMPLQKLTRAVAEAKDQKTGLRFVGWDDRTGAGFSNSSCVECERSAANGILPMTVVYSLLTSGWSAARDFRFLTLRGNSVFFAAPFSFRSRSVDATAHLGVLQR